MMSSVENPYHFLSTYRKDYVEKPIKLVAPSTKFQEFADPLNESFRNYLLLDQPNIEPPNEDGELYLKRFKEERKKLGDRYFSGPIRKDIIINEKVKKGLVSEYQLKYCDIEKKIEEFLDRLAKKSRKLFPDDTPIPLTTYLSTYKHPASLCPGALKPPLRILPKNNIDVGRESTAFTMNLMSEYTDRIGRLGSFIVRENMHGPLRPRPAKSNNVE